MKNNVLLHESGYGAKYDLPDARMFVVEGMEKIRRVIEENRRQSKRKKLSNNTVIEIDNCSPFEMVKSQKNLLRIATREGTAFMHGKGEKNWRSSSFMRNWNTAADWKVLQHDVPDL